MGFLGGCVASLHFSQSPRSFDRLKLAQRLRLVGRKFGFLEAKASTRNSDRVAPLARRVLP
jgi:hypothetical protein